MNFGANQLGQILSGRRPRSKRWTFIVCSSYSKILKFKSFFRCHRDVTSFVEALMWWRIGSLTRNLCNQVCLFEICSVWEEVVINLLYLYTHSKWTPFHTISYPNLISYHFMSSFLFSMGQACFLQLGLSPTFTRPGRDLFGEVLNFWISVNELWKRWRIQIRHFRQFFINKNFTNSSNSF